MRPGEVRHYVCLSNVAEPMRASRSMLRPEVLQGHARTGLALGDSLGDDGTNRTGSTVTRTVSDPERDGRGGISWNLDSFRGSGP